MCLLPGPLRFRGIGNTGINSVHVALLHCTQYILIGAHTFLPGIPGIPGNPFLPSAPYKITKQKYYRYLHIAMHAFTRVDTGGGYPLPQNKKAWKLLGTSILYVQYYYTLGDRYYAILS